MAVLLVSIFACTKLPGQDQPFAIGPLHFGMSLADFKSAFPGREMELVSYDTPRGENWKVEAAFGDQPPPPKWLTAQAARVSCSFWDGKLFRVRLHLKQGPESEPTALKKKFDRAYRFVPDQQKPEGLTFYEYETPVMKVFLAGGTAEGTTVAFVDLAAYRALEVSRKRWQEQAAVAFDLYGVKFGLKPNDVEKALNHGLAPSDFFQGLDCRGWNDEANDRGWELGFDSAWGLSAIAFIHQKRWPPDQVRAKLLELTKQYGQGQLSYDSAGYTLVIDVGNMRVSLIVINCENDGCVVSEGWLWSGPAL